MDDEKEQKQDEIDNEDSALEQEIKELLEDAKRTIENGNVSGAINLLSKIRELLRSHPNLASKFLRAIATVMGEIETKSNAAGFNEFHNWKNEFGKLQEDIAYYEMLSGIRDEYENIHTEDEKKIKTAIYERIKEGIATEQDIGELYKILKDKQPTYDKYIKEYEKDYNELMAKQQLTEAEFEIVKRYMEAKANLVQITICEDNRLDNETKVKEVARSQKVFEEEKERIKTEKKVVQSSDKTIEVPKQQEEKLTKEEKQKENAIERDDSLSFLFIKEEEQKIQSTETHQAGKLSDATSQSKEENQKKDTKIFSEVKSDTKEELNPRSVEAVDRNNDSDKPFNRTIENNIKLSTFKEKSKAELPFSSKDTDKSKIKDKIPEKSQKEEKQKENNNMKPLSENEKKLAETIGSPEGQEILKLLKGTDMKEKLDNKSNITINVKKNQVDKNHER